jgi:RNA polymerase-binding transcription factor DksA
VAPAKFVLPPLPQKPTPTYTPMKQMPDVMMVPKSGEASGKKRYSDSELKEFQQIILSKLADARKELTNLQASLLNANDHGTDDTATTFKMLEDGSDSLAKEEAGQLAARQRKFIEQLENALVRIENKTYGVCRVTGKLIPKERLRAVPHTTQSIEAKAQQYRD